MIHERTHVIWYIRCTVHHNNIQSQWNISTLKIFSLCIKVFFCELNLEHFSVCSFGVKSRKLNIPTEISFSKNERSDSMQKCFVWSFPEQENWFDTISVTFLYVMHILCCVFIHNSCYMRKLFLFIQPLWHTVCTTHDIIPSLYTWNVKRIEKVFHLFSFVL